MLPMGIIVQTSLLHNLTGLDTWNLTYLRSAVKPIDN